MNLTELEIQTVEAYVNMAAVAIQNAANLTRKENLIAKKQLLLDVTRELSMCSTMEEGIEKCFFYVGKVLNTNNIAVHLLNLSEGLVGKPTHLSKDSDWTEEQWMEARGKTKFEAKRTLRYKKFFERKKRFSFRTFLRMNDQTSTFAVTLALKECFYSHWCQWARG